MKNKMKKMLSLILCLMMSLSMTACTTPQPEQQSQETVTEQQQKIRDEFDQFLTEQTKQIIATDGLSFHFTVYDPASLGFEEIPQTLGDLSDQQQQKDQTEMVTALADLRQFDYEQLSDTQKTDYQLLERAMTQSLDLLVYSDLEFLFEPSQGIINGLNQNFLEFRLETEEDVRFYLTLLNDVERYIDQALTVTRSQAERGYFLQDFTLDETLMEIRRFTDRKEDNALIINFNEKLEKLDLSEQEKENYRQENRKIMMEQYLPSYNKAYDVLESLRGSNKAEGGLALAYGTEGREYYELLMNVKSATTQTVEDLAMELEEFLISKLNRMGELQQKEPYLFEKMEEFEFSMDDAEEILKLHEKMMTTIVPEIPEIPYQVSVLDETIISEDTIAYYLIPPMDKATENVIRINPRYTSDRETLFVTLAHEGFPGHLYQRNYYQNTDPSPIRYVLSEIGYTEGWAVLIELESYLWSGLESQEVIEAFQINMMYGYYLNCLCDIIVNGLGWNEDQLREYLENFGIADAAHEIYQSVISNPGVLLPYGAGEMKLEKMRTEAKKQLGRKYDDKAFYTVILNEGPRPFDLVEKDVTEWIFNTK